MVPKPKFRWVKQPQFQERLFDREFDPDEERQADRGDDRQPDDERRGKPVILVAFLEHRLQSGKADRHRRDADPVALPQQAEVHRLPLQGEVKCDHHHRARQRIDEEDRLPAVILGEIAADGRTDRRREGDGQREDRQTNRLLRLRQLGQHHRERHRDQHAARKSLQAPHRDHRAEIMGERAGDGEQRKQDAVGEHVEPEREHPAEIGGQRDHDDLADQIGGRDPRAVVDAGADAALDVEQRGVGDLDIQDRHERADHGREHRDPCRRAGVVGVAPGRIERDWRSGRHRDDI